MKTKMPRGTKLFDRGVAKGAELERERILKILRASRDAQDEVCEAQQWRALDEVIRRIG